MITRDKKPNGETARGHGEGGTLWRQALGESVQQQG